MIFNYDVSDLSGAINSLRTADNSITWEQGTVTGTGELSDSTTRIRTPLLYTFGATEIDIKLYNSFGFFISWFNNGKFVSDTTDWNYQNSVVSIPANVDSFRILARNTASTNITPANSINVDFSYVGNNLTNDFNKLTSLTEDIINGAVANKTNTGFLSGSVINLTGSITTNVGGHVVGNVLFLAGRIRISVTTRTAQNGGVRYTLPSNKVLDGTLNAVHVGISSYSDAPRNGEATIISGTNGANYLDIVASESFANISAGKTLLLYVPPTIIKLKDA